MLLMIGVFFCFPPSPSALSVGKIPWEMRQLTFLSKRYKVTHRPYLTFLFSVKSRTSYDKFAPR